MKTATHKLATCARVIEADDEREVLCLIANLTDQMPIQNEAVWQRSQTAGNDTFPIVRASDLYCVERGQ